MHQKPGGGLDLDSPYEQRVALNVVSAAMLGSDVVPPVLDSLAAEVFVALAAQIDTSLEQQRVTLELGPVDTETLRDAAEVAQLVVDAGRTLVQTYAHREQLSFKAALGRTSLSGNHALEVAALVASRSISDSVLELGTMLSLNDSVVVEQDTFGSLDQ